MSGKPIVNFCRTWLAAFWQQLGIPMDEASGVWNS